YSPETLDAYEVGFKSELMDHRLRLNGAVYYSEYSNMQVAVISGTGGAQTLNAGKAKIYGAELEAAMQVTRNLRVDANAGYIHDRFTHYANAPFRRANPCPPCGTTTTLGDATGNRLPMTPDWSASIGGTYTIPLAQNRLEISGNFYHNDGFYGEADN